jgi:hypothetical protein
MKCPHCLENFHVTDSEERNAVHLRGGTGTWKLKWVFCPACREPTVELLGRNQWRVAYPRASSRAALSDAVPEDVASDFREAVETLPVSPKASAGLSRRILQH